MLNEKKVLSPLHIICEQWQKRNEWTKSVRTTNSVERVIRHICESFAKCVRRSRQLLDKIKEIFSSYFTFYNTFAKTGVYDK